MCKNDKKAIALAQADGAMLFACYERTDYGKDLTTLVRWRNGVATSYKVNEDSSRTFERRITTFMFEGVKTIKKAFDLPLGTWVEPCMS